MEPAAALTPFRRAGHLFCAFEGRIGRRPYWIASIALALLLGLSEIALRRLVGPQATPWMLVLTGFAIFPLSALAAKRGQDRGRSPYWGVALVLFTVGAGLVAGLADLRGSFLPLAAGMKLASGLAWLVLLVDLGLLPGRPAPRAYRAAA